MNVRQPPEWQISATTGSITQANAILAACRSGSQTAFQSLYTQAPAHSRPPLSYCLYLATTISQWPPLVASILGMEDMPPQHWFIAAHDNNNRHIGLSEAQIEEYVVYSILFSVSQGHTGLVQAFLDAGLTINDIVEYRHDRTQGLLQRAVISDQPAMALYLISRGANVNMKLMDGGTPFTVVSLAARHSLPGMLRTLVSDEAGGRMKGSWALRHAAIAGSVDSANALLDLGADIDEVFIMPLVAGDVQPEDNTGTALHAAASRGKIDFVRWLLEKGIVKDVQNGSGQTACDVALSEGFGDIAAILGK